MVKKSERKEAWFRIVVMIITGVILGIWHTLIKLLIFVNFIITIFSGKRNKKLALFCEYWNTEAYKLLKYISFMSNKRPFPFSKIQRMGKFE
jgi:sorbitol-specific phosphotransferase system component IIC